MQIGSSTTRLAGLLMAVAVLGGNLRAQTPGYPNQPAAGGGAVPAVFHAAVQGSDYVDAYGNPIILPASYQPLAMQSCEPAYCGSPGVDAPYPYDMWDEAAYGAAGPGQCGPHYFDLRVEAVTMQRDEAFSNDILFTQLRNGSGPVDVLNSNELEYDYHPGFRIVGRYDIGPLSVFEFGYMGLFHWGTAAAATDSPDANGNGDLFSLFSNYGEDPDDVQTDGGSFGQSERSTFQSISLDSDIESAEASYRRYWVGFSPRVTGTILGGFRFTRLNEDFHFRTSGGDGSMDYAVGARNILTGFQAGGDVWICLMQGLRIGAEGKAGVYNNKISTRTAITSEAIDTTSEITYPTPDDPELFKRNQIAFITEVSADLVADVLPSVSLRGGFEAMFLNSLALAGDNFNTAQPYMELNDNLPERVPFLADQSHALYYGFHGGIEYIW